MINISIFGYDDKKIAAINYAFKKFTPAEVKILPANEFSDADILLFDLDSENTKKQLTTIHSKQTIKPIITLSYEPFELANSINLLKPINSEKLFSAVKQSLKIISKQFSDSNSTNKNQITPANTKSQKTVYNIAIDSQPVSKTTPNIKTKEKFFNSDDGLLGVLTHLYKENQSAFIDLDKQQQKILYVIPQTNSIYIRISLSEIQTICTTQVSVSFSKIELNNFNPDKITNFNNKAHLDQVIWHIALLTSNGRIPKTINQPENKLGLKYWPNLTRYKSTSDFIRFAAFFSQTPANLKLAEKLLKPKPRQLCQFISACHALGILTISESTKTSVSIIAKPKQSKYNVLKQIFKRFSSIMK